MYDCLAAPGTYNVYVLAVHPEFHGKGVGSTLLSLGLRHAAENGFGECSLHVFAENVAAVRLYEKFGFKEAGRYAVAEHPLFYHTGDMLLMTCAV
jgi:ribosomal protein S18 acetylase RimI-like enzyme